MPRKPISLGWGVKKEGKSIWTRNANKGVSVRGERRKKSGKIEWRRWDPYKSKVAAALLETNGDISAAFNVLINSCKDAFKKLNKTNLGKE